MSLPRIVGIMGPLVAVVLCAASANAQKAKPAKPAKAPPAAAPATAAPEPTNAATPAAAASPATPAPESASPTASTEQKTWVGQGYTDTGVSTDVIEVPGKTYYFVGLRYRGNLIPKFLLNMFVEEGKTIYTNIIGVEVDIRKDDFSLIPALSYQEYGTGDILFLQKGRPKNVIGNYSLVNSSMKSVYATVDLLWSKKLGGSPKWAFEYGAGFGLGIIFGDLVTNWVRLDPNGPVGSDDGRRFNYCMAEDAPGTGCNKADHENAQVARVGGFNEKSWFNGGSKPVVFPWISVPQVGIRFKPVKQFEGRLGMGMSLTGFWFGLSGNYGLEQPQR